MSARFCLALLQDQIHSVQVERDNRVLEKFQSYGGVKQSIGVMDALGGFVGFNPEACAVFALIAEFSLPVSIPNFQDFPSAVLASTHGTPSQSSSGTSAA